MGLGALLAYTATQWAIVLGLIAIGLAIKAWILWYLYRDAQARRVSPTPWLIAAALADLVTLIVWHIVRPHGPGRRSAQTAPNPGPEAPKTPAADISTAPTTYRVQSGAPPTPAAEQLRVTCPQCQNQFVVTRASRGPTSVRCERCGATGRV